MSPWLLAIPAIPLTGFLCNIFFGRKFKEFSAYIALAAAIAAAKLSLLAFLKVSAGQILSFQWNWMPLEGELFRVGFVVDPMSAIMLLVVTGIGSGIVLYSIGYMHGDPRFSRFFAYLCLFLTAMLILVLADHFLLLFIGWELVGLCSYLLISFWFEKPSAANAGKKAFLTTRIGDAGFLLGLFLVFVSTGVLRFSELHHAAEHATPLLGIAAVLIFCGAIGKSAQFPLHVWLPDAMEGPTPVSALIHAATMVAAGVYLIARTFVLFEANPFALQTVAVIGTITAFFAATIAVTQTDIKRVLAYSTISQLGLMMLGLGVGSPVAGFFHLVTHACFKALLFLGAGSVIHGTESQEVSELGGLWSKMRVTAWTFLIATIAISGIPPLAGFWSKDELLLAALDNGHPVLFFFGLAASFLTSFYMFRLFFLTFSGSYRGKHPDHVHESPWVMTLPLSLLAVASIVVGFPGSPFFHHVFQHFLGEQEIAEPNFIVMGASVAVAFGGLMLAAWRYLWNRPLIPPKMQEAQGVVSVVWRWASNKYYVDEFYDRFIVQPVLRLTGRAYRFDQGVIDRTVNAVGQATWVAAQIKNWIDANIVDGIVNGTASFVSGLGSLARRLQTGWVQQYLLVTLFSAAVFLTLFLMMVP